MSLRIQLAGLMIATAVVLVVMTYAIQTLIVMPAFRDLERAAAQRDIVRCTNSLNREIEGLSVLAKDWASWDDTYQFIEDHNAKYVASNLIDETFTNSNVNLVCLVDSRRQVVWGEARDIETQEIIEIPDLFSAIKSESSPLLNHRDIDDAASGILLTLHGPLLLASRPIITSKRAGPIRGSVVMGRFLNEREIAGLADRNHVKLAAWSVVQSNLPADVRSILARSLPSRDILIEEADAHTLLAYAVVNDLHDQPAIVLRVDIPRDVTAQGRYSARLVTAWSIVGSMLTLIAIWAGLHWRIIRPLQWMAAHAACLGTSDSLQSRMQFTRRDEIGLLATEFDQMVQRLAETRKLALDSAHRAGMAEVAAEVLHNVGNALNSVNCSVELLEERLASSKLSGLDRAVALLGEQAPRAAEFFAVDSRGAKLIDYFVSVNDVLRRECYGNRVEVNRLRETVRHISGIIAAQQSYAREADFLQCVDFAAILDEVLHLNDEQLRSLEIDVEVNVAPLPELQLHRNKLVQVIVNLVRNSIQSMKGQPTDARRLTINVRPIEDDGIEISVSDTGVGFGEAVRDKLFTAGFTTKAEGNGCGLHYCANAIQQAGGHIMAQSPGPGKGATFCIRLPKVLQGALTST